MRSNQERLHTWILTFNTAMLVALRGKAFT
jgi:hypothetical protein